MQDRLSFLFAFKAAQGPQISANLLQQPLPKLALKPA
jgi:hypothetical protein